MKLKNIFKLFVFALLFSWSPHSSGSDSEYWGFCNGPSAFADAALTKPKPEADWVCQAPTADQTGEAIERNTLRCLLDQKENCQSGAGGDTAVRGDHNVPRNAWYWIPGATMEYPDVRCECGCFTGDVQVLTHLGPMRLDEASKKASSLGGLSMAVFSSETDAIKGSVRLNNPDFIVGPEEKPIVHMATASGKVLTLTDSHPLLVRREGNWQMIRAEQLVFGDVLMSLMGSEERVTDVSSYLLPETNRLVYNFDTKGRGDSEHIIVANGLRVGDLKWQKRLDEQNHRVENLLKFARAVP